MTKEIPEEGKECCPPSLAHSRRGHEVRLFFCLFITRMRPMEIVARLCTVRFLSAVRAVALVGPGGGHKGSLHCAALRGLRPGNGLYPRHDLDRSHTSNDKTKKKKKKKSVPRFCVSSLHSRFLSLNFLEPRPTTSPRWSQPDNASRLQSPAFTTPETTPRGERHEIIPCC